jgi:hypothetical protein
MQCEEKVYINYLHLPLDLLYRTRNAVQVGVVTLRTYCSYSYIVVVVVVGIPISN